MEKEELSDQLNLIQDVELPSDLKDESEEERLYEESSEESQQDHKSKEALEIAQQKMKELGHKNETLRIKNANLEKLAKHRRWFSWAILAFVIAFVGVASYIVIQAGTPYMLSEGELEKPIIITHLMLSDAVIMMLLGTNLVQVVGVLWLVVRWLYPSNNNAEHDEDSEQPTE